VDRGFEEMIRVLTCKFYRTMRKNFCLKGEEHTTWGKGRATKGMESNKSSEDKQNRFINLYVIIRCLVGGKRRGEKWRGRAKSGVIMETRKKEQCELLFFIRKRAMHVDQNKEKVLYIRVKRIEFTVQK